MIQRIPQDIRELLKGGTLDRSIERLLVREALEASKQRLRAELAEKQIKTNQAELHDLLQKIKPNSGEGLHVAGWDVYGREFPQNGIAGGDHLIWTNFPTRYKMEELIAEAEVTGRRARINGLEYLVAEKLRETETKGNLVIGDVAGHDLIAACNVLPFHHGLLSLYAADMVDYGTPTTRTLKILSTRFYNSTNITRLITAIIADLRPDGQVKIVSAAHPLPVIYSVENSEKEHRFVLVDKKYVTTFAPLGLQPSNDPKMPEVGQGLGLGKPAETEEDTVLEYERITPGDIMFFFSDGITDHRNGRKKYFPKRMLECIHPVKHQDARTIFHAIIDNFRAFGPPDDDYTLVVARYRGDQFKLA
jgi:hypothetical protein